MTMTDRIAELTTELAQVRAAKKAVQSQEASTITFDGRTIIRADIKVLRSTENQIIAELNTLKAYAVGKEPPLLKGVTL